ncbi:ribokinase [bacterium]|nr:ribokinase [bacterium]
MAGLWIIGSSNVDYVLKTRSIAMPGETVIAESLKKYTGGKGFNQAVTCKQLLPETRFISAIGADQDASFIVDKLKKLGFDLGTILGITDQPTGAAYIQVSDDGENSIVVHSGANKHLTLDSIKKFEPLFNPGDFTVLQAELEPIETSLIIDWLKSKTMRIIFNLAPYFPFEKETFNGIDTLIVNETECDSILKNFNIPSFKQLGTFLNVPTVILTRGKKGAEVLEEKRSIEVKTTPITPVDTTGAGDAFVGSYAVARFKGFSSLEGVEIANSFGSYTATVPGAQPEFPESMKSRLRR